MTALPRDRALPVIVALVALSVVASVPTAQAAPLSEGATASGGTVPQSGNCPGGQQQDVHCLPGGQGSPARPGGPIQPPIMPPPGIPPATQPADREGPEKIVGWAKAMLHIHDDDQDVTYTSGRVELTFIRRVVQDMEGNTQYVLAPDVGAEGMTWYGKGRVFDCTVEGEAVIPFPVVLTDSPHGVVGLIPGVHVPLDSSRPTFGYMNVVGPDGGDFHSVMIRMFDPDARLIKTCPGDPPTVTEESFEAGYLLHILWQKNIHTNGSVSFEGQQTYDQGDPLDFLNLLPPGAAIPESARQELQASGSGTSRRYTWKWEMTPLGQ